MLLDYRPFFRRQLVLLRQHACVLLVDLADVVKQCGVPDLLDLALGQPIARAIVVENC